MCGIVGIVDLRGRRDLDRGLLHRMNESQHHRGPDEGGLHLEPGVGLGHRRLSIIDLASGQQPLGNEDGSVVVVYNGEIYNFQALMRALQEAGHSFRTRSDTEVIVHAWEEWGEACVERFRGMFAFALWDRNRDTLFLARDRLGIKPLYYAALADGLLLFGSELKSLLVHPGLSRALDPRALEEYLTLGYVPDPRTIYTSARKLPPGTCLSLRRGHAVGEPREYWDVPFVPVPASGEDEIGAELVERLREAVRVRLVSEVPLGAFLSGGVDSSAVVALMAQESPGEAINTCSIGFNVPEFNETEFAQRVAERYGTRHFVDRVESDDFDLLDRLADLYDEPFADSSAIPTYRVCELARRHVTVALSGDGGDEGFAGYSRHRWHMKEHPIRALVPQAVRGPVFGALGRVYPELEAAPRYLRVRSTLQSLARDSVGAYLETIAVTREDTRRRIYSPSLAGELQGYRAREVLEHWLGRCPADDPLARIQYLDMKTYLPGDILTKVDRASMAHALEVRVPILDHEFLGWASGLPPRLKLRGGEGKYIFKKALEPHLPADNLYRRKMGFAVPLGRWIRGPLRGRVQASLANGALAETGLFEPSGLRRLVDEHLGGAREHSAAIWALLMLDAFLRRQEDVAPRQSRLAG